MTATVRGTSSAVVSETVTVARPFLRVRRVCALRAQIRRHQTFPNMQGTTLMKLPQIATLLGLSMLASAATASPLWTDCNGCSPTQRQQAALNLTAPNTYQYIYVVDNDNRLVDKFETFSEVEPGSFNIEANLITTEASVINLANQIWAVTESVHEIEIGPLTACSNGAASFVLDLTCQFHAMEQAQNQPFFVGLSSLASIALQQFHAQHGANRPMVMILRFNDGSRVKLEVTLGQNLSSSALQVLSIKVVEAFSGEGYALPINRESASNFYAGIPGGGGTGDLEYLFGGWRFVVNRVCSTGSSSASCQVSPSGAISCEVRGRAGC